ncbi:hypothetical protein GO684_04515 [Wolbachia endosymbiont of Litomosoides brasiliensis]|nr:hypothetical protein [Wolbachia endosymbiont of Litomosoides brasiliensis]NUY39865.1 hypothetical protein [Wolbachia endosymbiont of Litomosoides brasiliensis]
MISAKATRSYAQDLLKSTSFSLDHSVTHWNDKRKREDKEKRDDKGEVL